MRCKELQQRVRCGPQHSTTDFQGSSPVCFLALLDCRPSAGSDAQNPALNLTTWGRILTPLPPFFRGKRNLVVIFLASPVRPLKTTTVLLGCMPGAEMSWILQTEV